MPNETIPNIPVLATQINDSDLFEKADGPASGQSQRVPASLLKAYAASPAVEPESGASVKISAMTPAQPTGTALFPFVDASLDPAINYARDFADLANDVLNYGFSTSFKISDGFLSSVFEIVYDSGSGNFDIEANGSSIIFYNNGQIQLNCVEFNANCSTGAFINLDGSGGSAIADASGGLLYFDGGGDAVLNCTSLAINSQFAFNGTLADAIAGGKNVVQGLIIN